MVEINDIKSVKGWMLQDCNAWFDQLAEALKETHVVVASCNKDCSRYLVPKGTENEITYYGKPANSFRVSDHWNWRSPIKKCKKEKYVQCYSKDMPWAARRMAPGKASRPMLGNAVMYYSGEDKAYHVVYGEKFDRDTKTWSFVTMDVARGVDIATKSSLDSLYARIGYPSSESTDIHVEPNIYKDGVATRVTTTDENLNDLGTIYTSNHEKGADKDAANA